VGLVRVAAARLQRDGQQVGLEPEVAAQLRVGLGLGDEHRAGLVDGGTDVLDVVEREVEARCEAGGRGAEDQHERSVGGQAQRDVRSRPAAEGTQAVLCGPSVCVHVILRPVVVAQAFFVSQKISAISSILASSWSATSASRVPFAPEAPASLVASLTSVCSCGYFSKCGGLK